MSPPQAPDWQPPVVAHPLTPKAATLMAAAIMKNRMSQILLNFLGQLESNGKLLTRTSSHCHYSSETLARAPKNWKREKPFDAIKRDRRQRKVSSRDPEKLRDSIKRAKSLR